jgi:hypothetical protein
MEMVKQCKVVCRERYTQYRLQNSHAFHTIDQHIRETDTFCPSMVDCKRWRSALTVDVEERILVHTEESSGTRVNLVQAAKHVVHMTVLGSP